MDGTDRGNNVQPKIEARDRKVEFFAVHTRDLNVDGAKVSRLGEAAHQKLDNERKKSERRQREKRSVGTLRVGGLLGRNGFVSGGWTRCVRSETGRRTRTTSEHDKVVLRQTPELCPSARQRGVCWVHQHLRQT